MTTQTSKKYHPAPTWLTDEYVENVLRKYYKDERIQLLSLDKIPASAIGENFVSILTRIVIKFLNGKKEKHETTFLTKTTCPPQDPAYAFFMELGVYTREMDIYDFVLPKLTQLIREIGIKDKLFADTVHVDREHMAIIFEDLSLNNYVNVDRLKRLDLVQAKMTLRKLALMHATASVLNERSPGIFAKNFDRGFFNRQTDRYKVIMVGIMESLMRYIEKVPELKEKYYKKFKILHGNVWEYGRLMTDAKESDFMSLVHGDFWTTNIMFSFDKENKLLDPIDVIPIDFQFSAWSSPAIDLHFFFNCAMEENLRQNHQPELLQYYYYILADTLKALHFKKHIPTLFEFNLQMQSRRFYAVFASLLFQPIQTYTGKEDATYQNLFLQTKEAIRFRDSMFEDKVVQKYIGELLPVFDREGLLDILF